MRTTLTIDDDNIVRLERLRKRREASFKEIVNAALRSGLDALEAPPTKREPFKTRAVDLGPLLYPSVKDALRAMDDEYDRKKLGLRAQLFVQVKVISNDQASLAAFSKAIQEFPEVMECHVMLGAFDFLLRVVTKDLEAYEKFYFDTLSRVPNIREVNSFVAAQEVKFTTAFPLRR